MSIHRFELYGLPLVTVGAGTVVEVSQGQMTCYWVPGHSGKQQEIVLVQKFTDAQYTWQKNVHENSWWIDDNLKLNG